MTTAAYVYSDLGGLASLRAQAAEPDAQTLRDVAGQFEAHFLKMMLKSMRDALPESELFGGNSERMYRDLFDHQLALDLAQRGGLGFTSSLVDQLEGMVPAAATPPANLAAAASPAAAGVRTPPPRPDEFVARIADHARRAAEALGVSVRSVLAQAALETGWGRGGVARADGADSHNLFGIKAGPGWDGERVSRWTLEYEGGAPRRVRDEFRAYGSLEAAFDDYVALVRRRFSGAVGRGDDVRAFGEALREQGYATDPAYADKIAAIAGGATLRKALAAVEAAAGGGG